MKSLTVIGGGGGEVTGSSYLVQSSNDTKILVDFGMFQGVSENERHNRDRLIFKPSELAGVLLTHAHLDHCGRLPLLVYGGFNGKIYMSAPTKSLIDVVLNDAARIAMEDMSINPLYTVNEVEKVMEMIEVVEYHKPFEIGNCAIRLIDAGHILGSSSIEIVDKDSHKKIVFSGDLGNTPEDIVRPTEYFEDADYVVMESTYGDKDHPKDDPTQILEDEIHATEKSGGTLLIPAFSIERTQEILHRLHHLKKDKKITEHIPVFLDSPMGIRATMVFRDYKEFYNKELQSHINDPFGFEGLVISENTRDSKEIVRAMNPKVIIAGSGMLSGGRILHHATRYLPLPSTRIVFVGYQAEETTGREVLDGARKVKIDNVSVQVNAHVNQIQSFSSHADQTKLVDWVSHIKGVKKVILTHGEEPQREALAGKIRTALQLADITLPKNGETIPLGN